MVDGTGEMKFRWDTGVLSASAQTISKHSKHSHSITWTPAKVRLSIGLLNSLYGATVPLPKLCLRASDHASSSAGPLGASASSCGANGRGVSGCYGGLVVEGELAAMNGAGTCVSLPFHNGMWFGVA